MRRFALASLVLVLASGCAHLRGPAEGGRTLTIRNDGHRLLDMGYRCTENGPARRLGTVTPLTTASFQIRPASCATIYLVDQPLGIPHPDDPAFAVVPLLGAGPVELVFDEWGMVMRTEPAATPDAER